MPCTYGQIKTFPVAMGDDMVSKDFMFYIADFIIDELSQSAFLAADVKSRVCCILRSPSCFILGHLYFANTLCANIAAVYRHASGRRPQ